MKVGARSIWIKAGALGLLALSACSQVLGIEDAHEDPGLSGNRAGTNTQNESTAGTSGDIKGSGGDGAQPSSGGAPAAAGASGSIASAGTAGTAQSTDSDLCIEYCGTIKANCDSSDPKKSKLPQYADAEQCFAVCKSLDPGAPGDRGVDTVHCRLSHAKLAQYELDECASAGPQGGGECGSECEVYCKMMMQNCTVDTTDVDSHFFPNMAACMTACESVPRGKPYSATVDNYTGNTLQCRVYHGVIAIMGAPEEHCEHAIGETMCIQMSSGGAGGSGG